jgi:hypothetical protein
MRLRREPWSGSQEQYAFRTFNCFVLFCGVFSESEGSTESYDDMGLVGEDERWGAFSPFHEYLVQSFPLTYVIIPLCDRNKEVNISFSLATTALR